MWYKNENGSLSKPSVLDTETSKVYAFVRKDFEQVEATEDIPAHWQWMEMRISKDALAIYQEHNDALDDVYAALTELAELIVGEE